MGGIAKLQLGVARLRDRGGVGLAHGLPFLVGVAAYVLAVGVEHGKAPYQLALGICRQRVRSNLLVQLPVLLVHIVETVGLGWNLGQFTLALDGAGDLNGLRAGLGHGVADRYGFIVTVSHAGGIRLLEPPAGGGGVGAVFTGVAQYLPGLWSSFHRWGSSKSAALAE